MMQGNECDKCGEHALECCCAEEFKRLCHQMAYGDDSDKTFDRYCFLQGLDLSTEEKEKLKENIFGE